MSQALFEVPFDAVARLPLLPRKADGGDYTLFDGSEAAGWSHVTAITGTPPTVLIRIESSVSTLLALKARPDLLYIIGVVNGQVWDEALSAAQAQAVGDWAVAHGWPEGAAMAALRACTTRLGLLTTMAQLIHIRPLAELVAMGGRTVREIYNAIALAPHDVSVLGLSLSGRFKKLLTVSGYDFWQVAGERADLLTMHNELYALAPLSTLGLLAVVQTPGSTFYPAAVKNATGMTTAQWNARRNRIGNYLTSIGKSGAAVLAATDEQALMAGIVSGMGYTMGQLWGVMFDV